MKKACIDKTRRRVFTGVAVLTLTGVTPALAAGRCLMTPLQPEGPFYPVRWPEQNEQDLTLSGKALGETIIVQGKVMGGDCTPLANALVELWQANTYGRYRHARDFRNKAQIDPAFFGLGRVKTDSNGDYTFRTIIPGSYAAGPGWQRPPHLHFKVWHNNKLRLVTQMYFADDPLNEKDLILERLSSDEQSRVIVPFKQSKTENKGNFNLHIPA